MCAKLVQPWIQQIQYLFSTNVKSTPFIYKQFQIRSGIGRLRHSEFNSR